MKNHRLRLLTLLSMMIALSFLLQYFEFPIPALFPAYLKIDPSDIPALFVGIFIGPIPAIIVELLKNVLHAIFITKDPNLSGEVANFFAGVAFILPVAFAAKMMRKNLERYTFKQTLIRLLPAFVVAIISMTIMMALVNYFFSFPLYGMTEHSVKIAGVIAVTPFNLFKGTLLSIVSLAIYPNVKPLFIRFLSR
jgi:riboflavin transporter FmnP